MNENDENAIHHIHLEARGHWPGRSCYCRPKEVEVNAPCGHLVVVLVHEPITGEARKKIKEDVVSHFRRGFHAGGNAG